MEINLKESSWTRAKRDTEKFRKDSPLWYWGVEVVGAVLFTGFGLWFIPDQSAKFENALYPGIGLIGGLIIAAFVVFVWNLFRVPYRQRNEARNMIERLLCNPFHVKIEGLYSPIPNPDDSRAILRIELTISNQSDKAGSIGKFALAGETEEKPINLKDYPDIKTYTELISPLYFLPGETKRGSIGFAVDKPIDVNQKNKTLFIYDNKDVPLMIPIDTDTMKSMAEKSVTRRKKYQIC